MEVTQAGQRSLELSEALAWRRVSSVEVAAQGLLVGLNAGEWGGGLRRIAPSGEVVMIESNESNQPCGGPLNPQCDPVHAIATLPWKPNCVGLAVGLRHGASHGRIAEVCGDEVRSLYYRAMPPNSHSPEVAAPSADAGEPRISVAFFGLARVGDSLLASAVDGLYRLRASGADYLGPLPDPQTRGDFGVSFAVPGVVLVARHLPARWGTFDAPLLVQR